LAEKGLGLLVPVLIVVIAMILIATAWLATQSFVMIDDGVDVDHEATEPAAPTRPSAE
jgi:hypothetical protein